MTRPSNVRGVATLVALLILLVPLPFFPDFGNPNNMTRLLLTHALSETGTTRIDPYQNLTEDRALHEGHHYSDKAPGMSMLGVPAYVAGRAAARALGSSEDFVPQPEEEATEGVSRMLVFRLIVLTTSGLLTALAGAAFYLFARRHTADPRRSLMATLTVFLATPILGWSVNFFGHAAAGSTLFLGFYALSGIAAGARHNTRKVILGGALLGLAMVIEYTVAPAAALIGCYGIWRLAGLGAGPAAARTGLGLLAILAALVPLFAYHTVSFGGPLATGYSNVVGFEGMEQGFMGLTRPNHWVLLQIIFGKLRGILWLSPILIALPWAVWVAFRDRWMRPEVVLSLLVVAYFLLFNASYFYWNGGGSMGPRHITPALPFAGVVMIRLWQVATGWIRVALLVLLGLSMALSIASVAVTMTPGFSFFQLRDHVIGGVLRGETWFAWYARFGLSQPVVFLIWLAVAGLPAVLLWRRVGRGSRPTTGGSVPGRALNTP